ncbi:hypothetical protein JCM10212_000931 [Sporobolomyces blumeae]
MSAVDANAPVRRLPTSIFSADNLVKRGWCTVATDPQRAPRPHEIYYELHGEDKPTSTRIVFIMGLNNSSFAWQHQLSYFSSLRSYSVLVFDNRGVGHSDSPRGAYKTSELAKDTVELLEHLHWVGKGKVGGEHESANLNIVGVSMGGMIAQELALLIPHHVRTLLLTSTSASSSLLPDIPSYASFRMFALLTSGTIKTPEAQCSLVAETLFPEDWLDGISDEEGEWKGKPRRQMVVADLLNRYNVGRRQPLAGRLGQLAAALSHRVTPARLRQLAESLPSTSKVAIIHGTEDKLIHVERARELHRHFSGSELEIVEGGGHALPSQIRDDYNAWIRGHVERED